MAKRRVTFEEIVTYEVEIDIPEDEDPDFDNGDGRWFQLLDEQNPDFITKASVAVNERTVLRVDGSEDF